MRVLPPHLEVIYFLEKRNLAKKFEKQKELFEENPFHPSLQTELIEIIDVNNHYQ